MNKVVELIIPRWDAVIPVDWPLELSTDGGVIFVTVSGKLISITAGAQLRGGPAELFERMLDHGYVREVGE